MDFGEINNKRFYAVLGVEPTATEEEIRKAYKKLYRSYCVYPEKGDNPNKERMQELNEAYDILKDKHKREAYDMHGEFVFENQHENQNNPWGQDFFGNPGMYNQNFGQQSHTESKADQAVAVPKTPVSVGLELIFSGGQLEVDEQGIAVTVEPGCPDQFEYWFNCKDDIISQINDPKEASIAYVLHIKKHLLFQRDGADLWMNKMLTLKQALLGFSFTVKFLDGKDLLISSVPGEVVEFGATKSVKGKGLPFYKNPAEFGNLIIWFEILSPKYIELGCSDAIKRLDEVLWVHS